MFQSSTIHFLKDLKKNNNKPWFDDNKDRYVSAKKDFEDFIEIIIAKSASFDTDINGLLAK